MSLPDELGTDVSDFEVIDTVTKLCSDGFDGPHMKLC
jgi:hypothetical protein